MNEPWHIPEVIDSEHWAKGPDGCDYDNLMDYICTGLLKWCGCGSPESALMYLRDTLADVKHRSEVEWKQEPPIYAGKISARMNAIPDGLQYIYWYWMDNMELIEHGGGVGGSWLTERGQQFLARLQTIDFEKLVESE